MKIHENIHENHEFNSPIGIFHEISRNFMHKKCMQFHKWKIMKIFSIWKMVDPQANSLREFAIEMINMIISDPKGEFKSDFSKKNLIYFSTRVQWILIHWTLVDFQWKFS